jgi:hypothetical protein
MLIPLPGIVAAAVFWKGRVQGGISRDGASVPAVWEK